MRTSSWLRLDKARSSKILSFVGTAWQFCRMGRATSYTAVPEVGRVSSAADAAAGSTAGLVSEGCWALVCWPEPRLRYRRAETRTSRIRITVPQNNAAYNFGFIGAVILLAYSPPQAVVEVSNFHRSLLLSLIIAWSSHQSHKTWFRLISEWKAVTLWWLWMISSNSQLSQSGPELDTRGNDRPELRTLARNTKCMLSERREWARHIPSKLAGKCTEMPKNMTRIMIRFVLTVAATVIPTARRGREKSEGWLQIWWYLEIRASQVNNNKQFGMKSTWNCLPPLSIESQQTKKSWHESCGHSFRGKEKRCHPVEIWRVWNFVWSDWRPRGWCTLIAIRDITLIII